MMHVHVLLGFALLLACDCELLPGELLRCAPASTFCLLVVCCVCLLVMCAIIISCCTIVIVINIIIIIVIIDS